MKKIGFLMVALLILMPMLAACGSKAEEKVVSYEIDPTKISTASAVEERLDSFVAILNEKTVGFSRVVDKRYNREEQYIAYFLVVYGDTETNPEKYIEDLETVVKQLFAYTAKFVAPSDIGAVLVRYMFSTGVEGIAALRGENVAKLKNAPPEVWKDLVTDIPLVAVPAELEE